MRKEFGQLLLAALQRDINIHCLTADLGFGILDDIAENIPSRYHTVGAAEQLLIGAGIGMAEQGKIPVCYSMSSFIVLRGFELLRNYANHENIPIKLVGSGRDRDYLHDGITHWADDIPAILNTLPNIVQFYPNSVEELEEIFDDFLYNKRPSFLSLRRSL